jgi:hypothetical protein
MAWGQTKTLLRLHRYLGLAVAPLVLFFAVSGAWQLFRVHQSRKDGSYEAPRALAVASDVHQAERLFGRARSLPFQLAVAAAALALALSTVLGVVAALRITRPRWVAVALLGGGVAVPALLYLLAVLDGGAVPSAGP